MPLTCSCDFAWEPGQLICERGQDFEPLSTSKRKRCQSCNELINIGDFSVKFNIGKIPDHEIEVNIYGEDGEVPMAPRYLCEKCGEIYHNLVSVGFECLWCGEDMREMLKDYQHDYAPPKLKKQLKKPDSDWNEFTQKIADGLKKRGNHEQFKNR